MALKSLLQLKEEIEGREGEHLRLSWGGAYIRKFEPNDTEGRARGNEPLTPRQINDLLSVCGVRRQVTSSGEAKRDAR